MWAVVPKSAQFSNISSPLCLPPGGQSGSGEVVYSGAQCSETVLCNSRSHPRMRTSEVSRGVQTLLLGITPHLSILCNKLNIFWLPETSVSSLPARKIRLSFPCSAVVFSQLRLLSGQSVIEHKIKATGTGTILLE